MGVILNPSFSGKNSLGCFPVMGGHSRNLFDEKRALKGCFPVMGVSLDKYQFCRKVHELFPHYGGLFRDFPTKSMKIAI